ncbi:MAG: hypothetical protein C5B60_06900 [Chloroflexi bacterium]|nr:MAG: hypothetical protein C5B60_06900 [Chloroflexota bacterium]
MAALILEAFAGNEYPQRLVAADVRRDWMDQSPNRNAYHCLPLTIANAYGWQLLLPVDVTATWNGGPGLADISVRCARLQQAISIFANGILTFDVSYVFRTPKGFHLLVTGPSNLFKDGIVPMTGVVESDWLPFTFTMNWQFTRPGKVRWRAGEPYCQICIVQTSVQQDTQPVIKWIQDDPEFAAQYALWKNRRLRTGKRQALGNEKTLRAPWEKDYLSGRYGDGNKTSAEHVTKLRLHSPIDERKPLPRGMTMNGAKIKNIVLTHVMDANGKRQYRVDTVFNSAAYYPNQILDVNDVEKLSEDESWQVQVLRSETVAHSHEH